MRKTAPRETVASSRDLGERDHSSTSVPRPTFERASVDEADGGSVLDRVSHRLVDGDLVGCRAALARAGENLAQLDGGVGVEALELVSPRRVRLEGVARLHDEEARLHRPGVELRAVARRPHRGHVRTGSEPARADHRLPRIRAGADDVGAGYRLLEGADSDGTDLLGELDGALWVTARHPDLVERPDSRDGCEMRARLNPSSQNGEDLRVGPGEGARGDGRGGAGPYGRDLSSVEQCERPAGLVVEEADRRLVRRQRGDVVAGEDRDELRHEDPVRVAGHRGQEPLVGDARGDAGRDRGASRAQLDERMLQGFEEEIEIQESSNVVSGEDEHG